MTDLDEEAADEWYAEKSRRLEAWLGPEHDLVSHSMIPYAIGGALDLYYFPNGIDGTAIATKELSDAPGDGSTSRTFDNYELVMFTREPISLDDSYNEQTPWGRIHCKLNAVLNCMARYSADADLNPNETCEFPGDMKHIGGECLIFDAYPSDEIDPEFGLLLLIRIHRSEMDYAREHGGGMLLDKLKFAGHYPYSDLDREPVV